MARLTPRKLPTQSRSRFTVDAIVQATAQLLASGGYEALTTNHVAERSGVSIGTLYQYFPNKPSLVSAVCVHLRQQSLEVLGGRLLEAANGDDALAAAAVADALLSPWDSDPRLAATLEGLPPELDIWRKCRGLEEELVGLLDAFLGERTTAQDSDLAAWALFTAVDGLGRRAGADRPDALADGRIAEEAAGWIRGLLAG